MSRLTGLIPQKLSDDGGFSNAGLPSQHNFVFPPLIRRATETLTEKSVSRTLIHICPEFQRIPLVDKFCFSRHELSGYFHLIEGSRQTRLSQRNDDLLIE